MALAGFEPARCPTVSGPLCPLSYSAIYRPQRRYAPGWVRLSGGPFVVLTKALRPRLHRRCFVLPGRLLLFTACFAAWRARPSGPDSWSGPTCGIYSPKEVGGRPSKGDSERRYGEKRLHLGIIPQFSIPYEYMQCQLYIVCILCYIIPYIVIILELAAENFNFCTFELLNIVCKHAPSVTHIIVLITPSHRIRTKLIEHFPVFFIFLDDGTIFE